MKCQWFDLKTDGCDALASHSIMAYYRYPPKSEELSRMLMHYCYSHWVEFQADPSTQGQIVKYEL